MCIFGEICFRVQWGKVRIAVLQFSRRAVSNFLIGGARDPKKFEVKRGNSFNLSLFRNKGVCSWRTERQKSDFFKKEERAWNWVNWRS